MRNMLELLRCGRGLLVLVTSEANVLACNRVKFRWLIYTQTELRTPRNFNIFGENYLAMLLYGMSVKLFFMRVGVTLTTVFPLSFNLMW